MSVTARCLIESQYVPSVATAVYVAPISTRTIIDKFFLVNLTAAAHVITVYIVPAGVSPTSPGNQYQIIAPSLAAGAVYDSTELRNQILNAGDQLVVTADGAAVASIRVSGRECST